jgi:PAS domain S-box-containing protein
MVSRSIGLKKGLVLFALLAVVLPLAGLGYFFLSYNERTTIHDITSENLRLAIAVRTNVSNFLNVPLRQITLIANLNTDRVLAPHVDALLSPLAESMGIFDSIMVLDRDGIVRHLGIAHNIRMSRREYLGMDLSESEHIALARVSKRHTWSDTYISPLTGQPTLSLTVPFDRGMVVGNFNLNYLRSVITLPLPRTHDRIYLVNSKGRIIAHPDQEKVLQQVNVSNLPVVQAGLEGREGVYEYGDNGASYISAVAIVPETGWMVVVERNRNEIFAPMRFLQLILVLVIASAVLLVAFFVWYVNSRLVMPVTAISQATNAISDGSFQPVPQYRGRFAELNELTENFNVMTRELAMREQSLADKNRDLEKEVGLRTRSVEEVRKNEEKLKLILENAPFAVYVLSFDDKRLYINRSAGAISGYSREELLGMNFTDLVLPEDRPALLQRRSDRLAGKPVDSSYEFRVLDKAGTIHWMKNHVITLLWEDQPATFNFLQDITDHKRIEAEKASQLQRIQDQQFALVRLAKIRSIMQGELEQAALFITETTAYAAIVERSSIWLLNDDESALRCIDLYEKTPGTHQRGMAFAARDYPAYFSALREGRPIDAADARSDGRTSEFTDGYLVPLGIASLLDAPIRLRGRIAGVVCFEHVGERRVWHQDEIAFASSCADQVALVITNQEKARMQQELRESEAFRKRVFESSRVPVVVMDAETLQYIDCNPAAVEIYRFASREATLGRTPQDVSAPEQYDGTPSPEKAGFYIGKALAEGSVVFEWRHQRPDGECWDAEVHLMSFQSDGRHLLQFTLQDITERKRAEKEIAERKALLEQIMDTASVAIFLVERDGRITHANRRMAEMFGRPLEELLGNEYVALVHPSEREASRSKMLALLSSAIPSVDLERRYCRKDGTEFWGHLAGRRFLAVHGNDLGLIGVITDVTARRQAEDDLKESEEKYRLLVENTFEAILIAQDGMLKYVNTGFLNMLGYTYEEATSVPFTEFIPDDDRAMVLDYHRKRLRGEISPSESYVFRGLKKDGAIRWLEIKGTLTSWKGRPATINFLSDITERKRSLEELEKSEERYRSLFESAGDAILLMDRERIVACNSQTLEMFGCTRDQIIGATPDRFSPPLQPDGRNSGEKGSEIFNRAMDGETQRFEWKHAGYNGTTFDAEVTLRRINAGAGQSLQAIVRDISDRKKAEAEREKLINEIWQSLAILRRSQKEWQDTFDNITDMISIHDKDFNIIRANKAFSAYLGMTPRDVLNRKCYDLMHHGAAMPIASCPHQKTLQEKIAVTEEVFDEKAKKTFRTTTYPYYSDTGDLIGSIHIARDITEEKEREMNLIMTERLASLGLMASGIAHEINNPLESVMICAEMLLLKVSRDTYDHAQFEKYLKIIDEEVMRCREITGTMLSFARRTPAEHQDVDIHLLLDKTIDLVGYQGRLRQVTVKKHYGEAIRIRGNEGGLRQVFLVLVVNALDAMENKGMLTIETGKQEKSAWIRISDTGPGVPKEILDRIFQPFFSTKIGKGGTGLGLSIAHRIVSDHRGAITVESEPGSGTAFTVVLPL